MTVIEFKPKDEIEMFPKHLRYRMEIMAKEYFAIMGDFFEYKTRGKEINEGTHEEIKEYLENFALPIFNRVWETVLEEEAVRK